MTIGGVPAQVLFGGFSAGICRLYQGNVVVPAGVMLSGAVPVIHVVGQTGLAATISVK